MNHETNYGWLVMVDFCVYPRFGINCGTGTVTTAVHARDNTKAYFQLLVIYYKAGFIMDSNV